MLPRQIILQKIPVWFSQAKKMNMGKLSRPKTIQINFFSEKLHGHIDQSIIFRSTYHHVTLATDSKQ